MPWSQRGGCEGESLVGPFWCRQKAHNVVVSNTMRDMTLSPRSNPGRLNPTDIASIVSFVAEDLRRRRYGGVIVIVVFRVEEVKWE